MPKEGAEVIGGESGMFAERAVMPLITPDGTTNGNGTDHPSKTAPTSVTGANRSGATMDQRCLRSIAGNGTDHPSKTAPTSVTGANRSGATMGRVECLSSIAGNGDDVYDSTNKNRKDEG